MDLDRGEAPEHSASLVRKQKSFFFRQTISCTLGLWQLRERAGFVVFRVAPCSASTSRFFFFSALQELEGERW